MLSCKEVVEQASEYVDRRMSLAQRLQFRLHLLICHRCRLFVKQFRAGIAMLKRRHQHRVDPDRVHAVIDRVRTLDQ